MRAPASLHDVLGEEPDGRELLAILAFALPTATVAMCSLDARPLWRSALAWLLLADIAAGCVANFTRSTNDYYARRPRNRWAFIAVHGHLPLFAWLVGAPMSAPMALWAFTIAAASAVNALHGRREQTFVAGLLLATGMTLCAALPQSTALRVASALFVMKVAFSFAVDHYRDSRGESRS